MLEKFAIILGRNIHVKGIGRFIRALYSPNFSADRCIKGVLQYGGFFPGSVD